MAQLARHLTTTSMGDAMPDTYKAVEIKEWGTRDEPVTGIVLAERPVPVPGAGEVLVRIFLRPINPSDLFSLAGAIAPCRCDRAASSAVRLNLTNRTLAASFCTCLLLSGSDGLHLSVDFNIGTLSPCKLASKGVDARCRAQGITRVSSRTAYRQCLGLKVRATTLSNHCAFHIGICPSSQACVLRAL